MTRPLGLLAACLLAGCAVKTPEPQSQVDEFLRMYGEIDQRLYTVASEAQWRAATDVTDQHTGARIGADSAHAAFRGSRYVIDNSRKFLTLRQSIGDVQFRQLDKILLNAAEYPGTIPKIVERRVAAEAELSARLDSFTFCLERRWEACLSPTTPNQIDEVLRHSRDLSQRRKYWEISKQVGAPLKEGLVELRDLRNRVSTELGYSSYFHLQVADYGMSVQEMMQLMETTLREVQPLYDQLHSYARRALADRYKQPVPETIPAHWLGNRWGQEWPGLVEAANFDDLLRGKSPEWIVEQAEKFYTSVGMAPLPKSFWEKSDLYQLPPSSKRKKNTHGSAWHINRAQDVRSLMSVVPNFRWFETAHHELGHVYYYLAYSNPRVPPVLREGANRAFHEAVGELIGMAARQEPYLKQIGLLPEESQTDQLQFLLGEALESVVFIPWSAGTMTHFEHDLYEGKLPAGELNRRWWDMVQRFQGITPPSPRGEQFCDGCTKTHVIDDAAQYYDYALATLIKHQMHDYIARNILKQNPRRCNYSGNKEVGRWLTEIMSLGATRDWRQLLREKTGEDLSSRAMLEYYRPLSEHLTKRLSGAAESSK